MSKKEKEPIYMVCTEADSKELFDQLVYLVEGKVSHDPSFDYKKALETGSVWLSFCNGEMTVTENYPTYTDIIGGEAVTGKAFPMTAREFVNEVFEELFIRRCNGVQD